MNNFILNVPKLCNIEQYCAQFVLAPAGDSQQDEVNENEPVVIEGEPSSAAGQGTNNLQLPPPLIPEDKDAAADLIKLVLDETKTNPCS